MKFLIPVIILLAATTFALAQDASVVGGKCESAGHRNGRRDADGGGGATPYTRVENFRKGKVYAVSFKVSTRKTKRRHK